MFEQFGGDLVDALICALRTEKRCHEQLKGRTKVYNRIFLFWSYLFVSCLERKSDCKVKGKVAFEIRMYKGIMVVRGFIRRINGLHTYIETQNKVIKI